MTVATLSEGRLMRRCLRDDGGALSERALSSHCVSQGERRWRRRANLASCESGQFCRTFRAAGRTDMQDNGTVAPRWSGRSTAPCVLDQGRRVWCADMCAFCYSCHAASYKLSYLWCRILFLGGFPSTPLARGNTLLCAVCTAN